MRQLVVAHLLLLLRDHAGGFRGGVVVPERDVKLEQPRRVRYAAVSGVRDVAREEIHDARDERVVARVAGDGDGGADGVVVSGFQVAPHGVIQPTGASVRVRGFRERTGGFEVARHAPVLLGNSVVS